MRTVALSKYDLCNTNDINKLCLNSVGFLYILNVGFLYKGTGYASGKNITRKD
jgi:hypothetical protein